MFIDDDKPVRKYRRREGRAIFYITVTALAACVLMIVGLMNVAQANSFDDAPVVLQGEIGDAHLLLEFGSSDANRSTKSKPLLENDVVDVVTDPTTTASTKRNGHDDTSAIDKRLMAALGLAGFIVVAGVSQLASRGTHRNPPPASWRSEA